MRQIRFRAWDAHNKEMINPYCELKENNHFWGEDMTNTHYISPVAVMQFIGITDINGKEIFEGDIVKGWTSRYPDSKTSGWIEYNIHAQAFQLRYQNCFNGHSNEFTHRYHFFEVIGNIYESPELLK